MGSYRIICLREGDSSMETSLAAYERAFGVDDHNAMMDLMTEDVKFSDPLSGELRSKKSLQSHLSQAGGVMKSITQLIEAKAVQGTNVFLKWVRTGTNAVTGKQYSFSGCTFLRFQGDRVAEHRDYFDPRVSVKQF